MAVEERPNMPTTTTEWANWSIALPTPLETLRRSRWRRLLVKTLDEGDHCPNSKGRAIGVSDCPMENIHRLSSQRRPMPSQHENQLPSSRPVIGKGWIILLISCSRYSPPLTVTVVPMRCSQSDRTRTA
jgi:hypothetical protein